jgi:hypothetical protein
VADTIEELRTQFFGSADRQRLGIPLPEDTDTDERAA